MESKNEVIIPKEEYLELIRKAERIETVKRVYGSSKYVSTGEILVVLGIEPKEEDEE